MIVVLATVLIALLLAMMALLNAPPATVVTRPSSSFQLIQEGPDALIAPSALSRLSWGAVLAGAVIALIFQLALNLLGVSVGATTLIPEYGEEAPEPGEVASGALVWVAVSSLISLFVGGWLAARFAGIPDNVDGMLHGLMVWGVVTLITFFLVTTTIGRMISGISTLINRVLQMVGRTAQGVAQGVSNVAQGVVQGVSHAAQDATSTVEKTVQDVMNANPQVADAMERFDLSMEGILNEAQMLLRQVGIAPERVQAQAQSTARDLQNSVQDVVRDPAHFDQTLNLALRRMFRRGQNVINDVDRDAAVRVLMERSDMTEEQARQTLGRWEESWKSAQFELEKARATAQQEAERLQQELMQKAEETRAEAERVAREAAQATTQAVAKIAGAVFLAIIVGAIAAGLGGLIGVPEAVPTSEIDTTTMFSSHMQF
jgi:hypothetical protein